MRTPALLFVSFAACLGLLARQASTLDPNAAVANLRLLALQQEEAAD